LLLQRGGDADALRKQNLRFTGGFEDAIQAVFLATKNCFHAGEGCVNPVCSREAAGPTHEVLVEADFIALERRHGAEAGDAAPELLSGRILRPASGGVPPVTASTLDLPLDGWVGRLTAVVDSPPLEVRDGSPLCIEVLGPTRALMAGRELELGGAKQRAVLTVLAGHAGAIVPTDRLLQEVWGPDVHPDRKHSLQTYISNLRGVLDPDRLGVLVADPVGYHLAVGPQVRVDVLDVEAARGSSDLAEIRAALGRWRGTPLALLDGPWADRAREQLGYLRRSLADRFATIAAAEGRADDAISPIAEVLADQPLDEALWRRHVELLLAVGRQAEALVALGALRRVLAEELGVGLPEDLAAAEGDLRARNASPLVRDRPIRELGRTSLAVLPFTTRGATDRALVADGLVDDLVVELCRFRDLFVIASTSTMGYRDREVDPVQVAAQLDVRYVVGGSVSWADGHARVTVHLLDGTTGQQLWSRRYDEESGELFSSRDTIVGDLVAHLSGYHGHLMLAEKRRTRAATTELAYETYLRGIDLKHRFRPDTNTTARQVLAEVVETEPGFARAHIAIGWTWLFEVMWGWTTTPERSLSAARRCAERALELDELDAEVHWLFGEVHHAERHDEPTVAAYRRAMELNPNLADVRANWAATANRLGRVDEATISMRQAIKLNPNRPVWYDQFAGGVLYGARRYEPALATLRRLAQHTPVSRLYLAAGLERTGQHTMARREVAGVAAMVPGLDAALVARIECYRDADDQAHLLDPLIAAGLPI
jgi:TolB-like protein/DNA-binding SARP family transcriptional activator/Flp pilus assembly protein TadD